MVNIDKKGDIVIEITSVNNEFVKQAVKYQQKKYRDNENKFLIEGQKAIQEACVAGIEIDSVFVLKEKAHKYDLTKAQGECKVILTTEAVLKKISTTDTPPEAIAIAVQKKYSVSDIKDAKKIVLLENIRDLGNLGTILRTAAAFSQDAVILYGDTVDLYNPKCVRSAVGNLWKVPVVHIKHFSVLKTHFKSFDRIATLPKSDSIINLSDFKTEKPYIIMFGSEATGLSEELIDFSTQKVTIEMASHVESLNLSVSVGILLYKLMRS